MWGVLALNTLGTTVGTSYTTVSTRGGVYQYYFPVLRGILLTQLWIAEK